MTGLTTTDESPTKRLRDVRFQKDRTRVIHVNNADHYHSDSTTAVCLMMKHLDNDFTIACVQMIDAKTNIAHNKRIVLDSGSTTNLFQKGWATEISGQPALIKGLNNTKVSGSNAVGILIIKNQDLNVQGYLSDDLPNGCVALLGRPTIRLLITKFGFDVNFHMKQPSGSCHSLKFDESKNEGVIKPTTAQSKRLREIWLKPPNKRRKCVKNLVKNSEENVRIFSKKHRGNITKSKNFESKNKRPKCLRKGCDEPADPRPCSKHPGRARKCCSHSCHQLHKTATKDETSSSLAPKTKNHTALISQKQMLKYLERKPIKNIDIDHVLQNKTAHKRVSVNPDLPAEVLKQVHSLLKKYSEAFQTTNTGLCKPLNVPPVKFKLKPNAKAVRVKQQRFNPATEKLAAHLTREHLKSGLLEDAHKSSWCSRTHFALKAAAGERNDGPNHKIRECGDYREVNEQIEKIVTNVPDGHMMIKCVAKFSHHIESDWHTAYNSMSIHKDHRDILTRCTPLGPKRPSRLQFGIKNAQALCYGAKLLIYERDLKPDTRENLFSFIDDDRTGKTAEEGWDVFLSRLEDLLKCMVKNNATLRPEKTRIGFTSTEFFGVHIENGKTKIARKNLLPIEQMHTPRCVGDIRRVLGVFVQSKNYIENYSEITKPLSVLLRKSTKFLWGAEQEHAFETMREKLLSRPWLHVVDYKRQLHLDVDASQFAMGASLFQINDKGERDNILFASKAFDHERGKSYTTASPFYREARAIAHFMKEVRGLTALSPFKLMVHSDHLPLKWMKLSRRGTICDFVLFDMGGMDYEILYKPGKINIVADALSRYPMVSPNKFHLKGLIHALNTLLKELPKSVRSGNFWLNHHTRMDTLELARVLQVWQGCNKLPLIKAAKDRFIISGKYDFALLMPEPCEAPALAKKMFAAFPVKDFAILIPTDLIHQVPLSGPEDNQFAEDIQNMVDNASKIVLTGTGYTWLFRVAKQQKIQQVLLTKAPLILSELQLKQFLDKQDMDEISSHHPMNNVHMRTDGLILIRTQNVPSKVYVPKELRKPLMEQTHVELGHLGSKKVFEKLDQSFTWPTMKQDTRKFGVCAMCVLAKAKRNLSHGQFNALAPRGPHEHFSVDFYGISKTEKGNTQILTIVDTFTSYVQFIPCKNRTADTFRDKFIEHVIFKTGVPLHLRSDAAQEFLSQVSESMLDVLNISHTSTLGYNPTGNSRCERLHAFLGPCLRMLKDQQCHNVEGELNSIAHAWNTSSNDTLGCSPFELHHGVKARSKVEAIIARSSQDTVPTVSSALSNVQKHAAAYKSFAATHAKHVRDLRMQKLNKGSKRNKFKIGDIVMVYKPPRHNDTIARKRKAKHMMRFVGPARIEQILNESNTAFGVRMVDTNDYFERTIANIRHYPDMEFTPPEPDTVPEVKGMIVDNVTQLEFHHGKIPLGQIVAVLDSERENNFRIGKVIENHKEWHLVHLFLAKGKDKNRKRIKRDKLVFKLGFHDPKDGKLIMGARDAQRYNAQPWTAKLDKASNLVIAVDLHLDKRGMLSQASYAQLPSDYKATTH